MPTTHASESHRPGTFGRRTLLRAGAVVAVGGTVLSRFPGTAHAAPAVGDNLVPNGDFETLNAAGFPTGWGQFNTAFPVAAVNDPVHGGSVAVRMSDPDGTASSGLRSQVFPVTPGRPYLATAHVVVFSGAPQLYLEWRSAGGARIGVTTATAVEYDGWQVIAVRDIAPAEATRASVLLYSSSVNAGVAVFDDVAMVEASTELGVPNGDFELVSGEAPTLWNQLNPAIPYHASHEHVRGGSHAVHHGHDSWTTKGGLRSSRIPITPGTQYRATAQAYNAQGNPMLGLEFWDAQGTRLTAPYGLPGKRSLDWQPVDVLATAPIGAVTATVLLYSLTVPTSTWFDDVVIEEVPPTPDREFRLIHPAHPRYNLAAGDVTRLRQLKDSTEPNPLGVVGKELYDQIVGRADAFVAETSFSVSYYNGYRVTYDSPPTQPAPMPPPPGFTGKYPYWSGLGKAIAERVDTLAAAYTLTGRTDLADKVVSYLDTLAGWVQWNDPQFGARADQFTGYVTQSLLAAYEQVHDQLTPDQHERFIETVSSKGLELVYEDTVPGGGQIGGTAPTLALGGLVMLGEDSRAERYLTRACEVFESWLDARMESGSNEGFSYTAYSSNAMVRSLAALARVTGDTSLSRHPFFTDLMWRWLVYAAAPPAGYASYSDALAKGYAGTTLHYMNRELGNGYAGWLLREADHTSSWPAMDQLYGYQADAPVRTPDDLPHSGLVAEVGLASLRSGWAVEDSLLTVRAIDSAFGHNHFDQNSVQLAIGGAWIGRDPGYQDLGTSGPTAVFSQRTGHSTILLDGDSQDQLGQGELSGFFAGTDFGHVVGTAPGCYVTPAVSQFDRRVVRIGRNRYVMIDQLAAPEAHDWDWVMFHGPLYGHAVDGAARPVDQAVAGQEFHVHNGHAQLWGWSGGQGTRTVTFAVTPGAEQYGVQTRIRSTDTEQTHFLTLLEAAAVSDEHHLLAEQLVAAVVDTGGPTPGTPVRTENAGTTYLTYSGGAGGWIDVKVDIAVAGDHVIDTIFMTSYGYGQTALSVDGQPLGGSYDPAFFGLVPGNTFRHGTVHLTAGEHVLRFRNTGASTSGGTAMAISSVRVIPAATADAVADNGLSSRNLVGSNVIGILTDADVDIRKATLGEDADAAWQVEWVAQRTGGTGTYRLDDAAGATTLVADADFVVAQLTRGRGARALHRLGAINATTVTIGDLVLLASDRPVDVALATATAPMTELTVRATEASTVRVYASRPRRVTVNGIPARFGYRAAEAAVSLSVPAGTSTVVLSV
ncbi:heparinase II/III domain-containing protein [Microlunatus sp. Y2014]|uniref:heparinase II/III domain-containing protein n=1 Tax=Microlunatus sp. Y2014 TaxID=3418488 RepID=UPI003DA7160E